MALTISQIDKAHQAWIDSVIAGFTSELNGILSSAKAKLQARLHGALTLDASGRLARTAANSKAIRKLDQWFMEEMEASGYLHLIAELTNQFPGQFQFFQQTLEYLGDAMKEPLPKIEWSARDLQVFSSFAGNTRDGLTGAMEAVAATARGRVLLSVGGLKFSELVGALAVALDRGVPQATGIAETATVVFYRTLAAQGYQRLDKAFPGMMRFKYYGPEDVLTRPWCSKMMRQSDAGTTWTKAELDAMTNGSTLGAPVLTVGGGWRCRHQFLVAVDEAASGTVAVN